MFARQSQPQTIPTLHFRLGRVTPEDVDRAAACFRSVRANMPLCESGPIVVELLHENIALIFGRSALAGRDEDGGR